MKITINRDIITDRMNALALAERTLIQRTQIPQFQFRQARQSGQFDGHTTLNHVHRLATELGISLGDLLSPPQSDTPQSDTPPASEDDVATLIPLLVSATHLVSVSHAARVLGWTRDRIETAVAAIPARLDGTGLRLHNINGRAKITTADATGKATANAIVRLQTMTAGLKANQAATLRRIVDGESVFQRNIGNQEKLTLGALKNMGCIELDEKAQYRVTAAMQLALPDVK